MKSSPNFKSRMAWIAALALTLVPGLLFAQSFPDDPLQTAASKPAANIMFILDDSGSMAFDYMPDTLASDTFTRKNAWINPLAYDPSRTYRAWRDYQGNYLTTGLSYTSAWGNNSLLSSATNLTDDDQVFYAPINYSLARGNTAKSNYYQFVLDRPSSAVRITRCEFRSGSTWNRNCISNTTSTSTTATPFSRTLAQEMINYATWYSYHRTRMKVAKAGATEAFLDLDPNLRVGYRSIWGRSGMDIPVGTDNGLFRNANKSNWYSRMTAANGSGGTPLHGALSSVGEYFKRSDASGPWGPESGTSQFSCRQNFTILTTDGYWNNDNAYIDVGNSDNVDGVEHTSLAGAKYKYTPRRPFMDTGTSTLADVAMEYWKTDLRTDLDNNVQASVQNPAFWQHMVTFGISIGLDGTLDPANDLQSLTNGSKAWPDPWRLTTTGSRSWSNESPRRIDDLWHAAVNGHGAFSVANDPDQFAKGMKDALASIRKSLASGSNVSTSSTSLQTDTRVFHATYYSGVWTGELAGYDISSSGISQDPVWVGSSGISPLATRKVITHNGTTGVAFPTSPQSSSMLLGYNTLAGTVTTTTAAQISDFIKGSRAYELYNGGEFRNRESLMSDIVNSSPIYSMDSDTIYVGSNGGMLHGFNATTGKELLAYVPAGLNFGNLGTLPSQTYRHKFFVDGQLAVSNFKQTPNKNYLIGSLGRGGKGLFGLDVTSPTTFGNGSVLWDNTNTTDVDMGYVTNEIIVAQTNGNTAVALVPNGLDSTSGKAVLFVVRLSDGVVIRKIDTGVAGGNALASPRGWDSNKDGKVDYVYAGDLKGNLWKFDLTSTSPASWGVALSGQPLFRARDAGGAVQPITGGLSLGMEAFGNRVWVFFGTGKYLNTGDITSTTTQTMYGIIDTNAPVARSQLTARTFALTGIGPNGRAIRALQTYTALPSGSYGWHLDLGSPYPGERVIERGFLTGRVLVMPSVVPIAGNACDAAGRGFLTAIDAFTGTSVAVDDVNHPYFDIGGDGNENNDYLGSGSGRLPVSSIETSIGMVTRPVLVGDQIVYGGSSGGKETEHVRLPPGKPKRLSWREMFRD